uniref:Uncharacterized protein n=1 Tax=Rhizophagus irregularis (strain DAOM 181602 / DAOM 197198 / MUCL 43194) TaxID=747089 RepID=U9SX62_RHIID
MPFAIPIKPWPCDTSARKIPNKAINRSDLNPNNEASSSSNDQIPNKTNNSNSLNDPNKANDYWTIS